MAFTARQQRRAAPRRAARRVQQRAKQTAIAVACCMLHVACCASGLCGLGRWTSRRMGVRSACAAHGHARLRERCARRRLGESLDHAAARGSRGLVILAVVYARWGRAMAVRWKARCRTMEGPVPFDGRPSAVRWKAQCRTPRHGCNVRERACADRQGGYALVGGRAGVGPWPVGVGRKWRTHRRTRSPSCTSECTPAPAPRTVPVRTGRSACVFVSLVVCV